MQTLCRVSYKIHYNMSENNTIAIGGGDSSNKYIEYVKRTNSYLKEVSQKTGISTFVLWSDYLWCVLRHRTLIKQYVYSEYWRLSERVRREGLTYHRLVKLMNAHTDSKYVHYLKEKDDFNEMFKDFIRHGWIRVAKSSFEEFEAFAKKHDALFIKPAEGQDGEGIRKHVQSAHQDISLHDLYETLKKEDAMVEECIIQHPAMSFGTKSVNTIKTTTATDSKGNVRIMKAMLRLGIGDSVIDNLAAGGAIYDIDIEHGYVSSYGYSQHGEKLVYHPGSKNVLIGFQIPNWDKVVECTLKAAKKLPQIQIIGWDIAITENGVDLIEGNHNLDYLPIEYGTTGFYKKFKEALR